MVVFFSVSAELRTMPLPTAVEPVKAILFIAGCSTNWLPTRPPGPVRRLNTPFGSPASSMIWAIRIADRGVRDAGLWITQFPAARAGAIFVADNSSGKLNGVIAATTPSGSRSV